MPKLKAEDSFRLPKSALVKNLTVATTPHEDQSSNQHHQ